MGRRDPLYVTKHALRSVKRFRNWPAVVGALVRGEPPTRVELRDGTALEAPENSTLLSLVQEIFVRRVYTPASLQIEPDDVVVDVGANIGVFTVYAAQRTRGRVVAVEPFPGNVSFIRRNLEENGLDTVRVREAAMSGHAGGAELSLSEISGGHLLFERNVDGPLERRLEVETVTLGGVVAEHGLERIDFLKLDCEGSEGEILREAGPDLLGRVRKIAMEFHDNVSPLDHREMRRLLDDAGFATEVRWNGRSPFGYLYGRRHER